MEIEYYQIVTIIFMHFMGDFVLQNDYMAQNKGKNNYILFVHSFLWACCINVGLWMYFVTNMYIFIWLVGSHTIIDSWKCKKGHNNKTFTYDQILHGVTIILPYVIAYMFK